MKVDDQRTSFIFGEFGEKEPPLNLLPFPLEIYTIRPTKPYAF
jgi:hypothetical protein